MQRLTDTEIKLVHTMTRDGLSLNTISKKLALKKTSVYYHFLKTRGKTNHRPEFVPQAIEQEGEIVGISQETEASIMVNAKEAIK